jgi:hypothetical protein
VEGGFAESLLRLNQGLSGLAQWIEETIRQPAKKLADQALGVWTCPSLAPSVLEAYRHKVITAGHTMDDQHLASGPMRRCSTHSVSRYWLSILV